MCESRRDECGRVCAHLISCLVGLEVGSAEAMGTSANARLAIDHFSKDVECIPVLIRNENVDAYAHLLSQFHLVSRRVQVMGDATQG